MAHEKDPIEAAATEFLRLVDAGVRGPGLNDAFAPLANELGNVADRHCKKFRGKLSGESCEDVVQTVLIKVLQSPPTRPAASSAARTLRAWVIKTTKNHCIDSRRKLHVRRDYVKDQKVKASNFQKGGKEGADGQPRGGRRLAVAPTVEMHAHESAIHHRQVVAGFLDFLRSKDLEKNVQAVELMAQHPDLTGAEYAEEMGVSRPNWDQIKSRTKKLLVRYMEANPS